MRDQPGLLSTTALSAVVLGLALVAPMVAQGQPTPQPAPSAAPEATPQEGQGGLASRLLQVPINTVTPGGIAVHPGVVAPKPSGAMSAERGLRAFNAFNCVGCHAPSGGGGMGPSLSEGNFKYGTDPANIYLTIVQGRPLGMPAWGTVIPEDVVWDIVAYVENIKGQPVEEWGTTVSQTSPSIQQVPAQTNNNPNPWRETQPFKYGQKP